MATNKKEVFRDKLYRLADSRSGESCMIKTGKNGNLLVYDKTSNVNRPIRHCPNEKSVFIDEQSSHALVEPIIFVRGVLNVPYTSPITQKFLDISPDNVANGGRWFEEVNDEIEAKEGVEIEELILDIKQAIRDKSKEKDGIYALEMVAGVLLNSIGLSSKMSKEELKRTIYNEVDRNPYYFCDEGNTVNIFNDETIQRKYMTLRALQDGIIKKSPNSKAMLWKDKKVICNAPQGIDLIEYFADYLSTDEGMLVLEEMKRRS